jgi:hypothetical protein
MGFRRKSRRKGLDDMIHRGLASLAFGLGLCFLFLSRFDAQFFLIHFYESLVYFAIVMMLFYFEDRWAYMMGIVAPAVWLVLTLLWNGLPGISHEVSLGFRPASAFFPTGLLTTMALLLSVALIVSCAYRWRREFSGLHKGWSTLLVSLAVVGIYYAVLVAWILRWPPGRA